MEKFFNDIVTGIAQMNSALKISIVALLALIDILLLIAFVKNISNKNNKPKIKVVNVLLFIIISGIILLFSIYGF